MLNNISNFCGTPLSGVLDSAVAKNILKSHKFRTIHNQLFSISASGFSVYTNGSFCGLGSVNIKAGAVVFFENIDLGLGIEVIGIVSFTLAELQAIALALECVPNLSLVCLFSNSQAVLDVCRTELLLLILDFQNKY
ncbi:hypothetical protein G9A89_011901 [Geosiphon pyriformis]|nr:hypothetical protein G9A89_011901 [Geosiphon pyriformis]